MQVGLFALPGFHEFLADLQEPGRLGIGIDSNRKGLVGMLELELVNVLGQLLGRARPFQLVNVRDHVGLAQPHASGRASYRFDEDHGSGLCGIGRLVGSSVDLLKDAVRPHGWNHGPIPGGVFKIQILFKHLIS